MLESSFICPRIGNFEESYYTTNPSCMKSLLFSFFLLLAAAPQVFAQNKPLNNGSKFYELDVRVFDADTYMDMDAIKVKLINLTTKQVDSAMAVASHVTFVIEKCNVYELLVIKKGYLTRRSTFDAACYLKDAAKQYCISGMNILNAIRMKGEYDTRIEAEMPLTPVAIDKVFRIENIYYDLDKSFIRPDAAIELDKLVNILKDNPKITVELGSHTDCRATSEYNNSLSQRRADAAVAYIVEHGIPQGRITAKGYGETKLTNRCRDGVPCTETEHQRNRRTEVRITGILE